MGNPRPINAFELTASVRPESFRLKILDRLLNWKIPFNRGLGLQIRKLSAEEVEIFSPSRRVRQNHVKGAHACALALLGEYPAGLLLAQKYSISEYRPVIGELRVEYLKQGRGGLRSVSRQPENWPAQSDEFWVEMKTDIYNEAGDTVAIAHTRWQIKSWALIEKQRKQRAKG